MDFLKLADVRAKKVLPIRRVASPSGLARTSQEEDVMIRSELVQRLSADNPELRPTEIEAVVDTFFETIIAQLAKGGRVELRGFGAFSTREREARSGRNPRTGDSVSVPAKKVPYFKAGKEMREQLNAG